MMKCTSATVSGRGQRGTTTQNMPGYRKKNRQKVFRKERERRSGQDGNQRQRSTETAAGKVSHRTKAEREKLHKVRRRMSDYVRMHKIDQKKSTQETSKKSQSGALGEMLLGTREEEEGKKKTAD